MRFACLVALSFFVALPSADARRADGGAPALIIPLLIPADDVRQGFARIINHSGRAGTVRIWGTDDGGRVHGPVTLFVNAGAARELSARDLEAGNASKGLSGHLGDGEGSWRLRLESDLDIEAGAYIRTPDGFVASVHDIVRTAVVGGETVHRVPIFNPGSNRDQVSLLRLVNLTDAMVDVTIEGRDDEGASALGGEVRLTLPAGGARYVSAQQLESGGVGLDGRLGDGEGRWQLSVTADGDIDVVSLLQSSAGHLANLSMSPRTVSAAGSTADAAGPTWESRHNLTSSQYQDAVTTYARQGYRPVAVSGYAVGGEARFAAIWSKEAGPAWESRHNLTSSQYQDALATYARQGYRPVAVSGYAVGGEARFAAIWNKGAGPDGWEARHNMTPSYYHFFSGTQARQSSYRPVAVSGYAVGGREGENMPGGVQVLGYAVGGAAVVLGCGGGAVTGEVVVVPGDTAQQLQAAILRAVAAENAAFSCAAWAVARCESVPAACPATNVAVDQAFLAEAAREEAEASTTVARAERAAAAAELAATNAANAAREAQSIPSGRPREPSVMGQTEARFAAILSEEAGPAWESRHNLTSSQYQDAVTTYARQGYRPVAVSGYAVGGEARFAAIWSKEAGPAWESRHNLTSSQYQDALATYARQGYRPVAVSGYAVGGEARFAAIWSKTGESVRTVRHNIPLFLAAGHARQGFARIINHSDRSGTVRIEGIDDEGTRHGPVSLNLGPRETAHFNSRDLEAGNASKGLSGQLGNGIGNWRLELDTDLDIVPLAYVRTGDGFLTGMNAVARTVEAGGATVHQVPIFNSGSNRHEVSWLRVANLTDNDVLVTIREREDAGQEHEDVAQTTEIREVRLMLPSRAARRFSAQQLESGDHPELFGRLVGTGKRRLLVTADGSVTAGGAIEVMSLVQSPTGHLSNLSTTVHRDFGFEVLAVGTSTVRPLETIHLTVPGGLGDSDYTVLMDLSGTGEFPEDDTVEVDGLTTDDDRILFASPLTQILPETNTSHRLAVRVRREAGRQLSNVLRFSIEEVTIPNRLSGYPTTALEVVLKSIYTFTDDPLLNADASSIQPGTMMAAGRTLGLDSELSDVQAESLLQSLFGGSAVDLAESEVRRAESLVSLSGARQGNRERNFTSPFAAEFEQYGATEKCEFISARKYCEAIVGVLQCAFRAGENNIDACGDEGGPRIIEGFARSMQELTAPISNFRRIGGRFANKIISKVSALQGVLYANTVGGTIAKVFKTVRVLNEDPNRSGVARDFVDDGTGKLNLTSEGLKKIYENGLDALEGMTSLIPGRLQQAEEDAAGRNFSDNEKDAFWTIANRSERLQREVEAIEDHEEVHTGEEDPKIAIRRNPDTGSTVVGSGCRPGYREFPLGDGKTSTCVFESLVEENCYRGSRQPSGVDLGGSEACLYYSLDFFQADDSCRENYERVYFQERWTCRWSDLGPNQPAWYTLHKMEEEKEGPERALRTPEEIREFCRGDRGDIIGGNFSHQNEQYCTYCGYTPSCDLEAWKSSCKRDSIFVRRNCPPVAEAGPPRRKDASRDDPAFRMQPGGELKVVLTDYIEDPDGGPLSFAINHQFYGWSLAIDGAILSISRTSEYDVSGGLAVTATDDEGYSEDFQFWLYAEGYQDPEYDNTMSRDDAETACGEIRAFGDVDYRNCVACGLSATCDLLSEWLPRCDILSRDEPPYCPSASSAPLRKGYP